MAEIVLKNIKKIYPNEKKRKSLFGKKTEQKKSNLEVTEEGVVAVQDFNLTIKEHEFVVLVGPSGCGKSTTLRMIAGLEDISAGELYIDGKLVNDVAPKDRDIAMVFQSYALYPNMTVYDNMAFTLKLKKVDPQVIDEKVRAAAETLGITAYLDRKPKALSGGQRQRVAIARALSLNPSAIIADEPTSALDVSVRAQILNLLTDLKSELGLSMIFISHDIQTVRYVSDRIIVMNHGQIMEDGPAKQVFEHPTDPYTKTLLGAAPSLLHPKLGE